MLYLDVIVSVFSVGLILAFAIYLYLEIKKKMNVSSEVSFLHNQKNYPECPNFFEIINEGGQKMCKNVYQLGKCNVKKNNKISAFFDEKDEFFSDNQRGNLRKCLWAKECDVSWDSIDRLC